MYWLLLLVLAGTVGCNTRARVGEVQPAEPDDALTAPDPDRDGDGLCDMSELELGTNPDDPDTDGDGLPDFIEVQYEWPAADVDLPGSDRVALLSGTAGAAVEFPVRLTVDGNGFGQTGSFEALTSIYKGETAEDFYIGANAVSADPPEHVRGIVSDAEHFAAVLGSTRLAFSLRFEFPDAIGADCSRALPFLYGIKSDDGEDYRGREHLLVVAAENAADDRSPWCLPKSCL